MIGLLVVLVLLVVAELGYFKIADRFNIIDKPNERSSHSKVVIRGGGVIFVFAVVLWFMAEVCGFNGGSNLVPEIDSSFGRGSWWAFVPFVAGLVLVSVISFVDDLRSLPDSVRLVGQFVAMGLMFWSLGLFGLEWWWIVIALVVCVGITNVYNFMDGINGITGGYSLVVLVPLYLAGASKSLVVIMVLADLVFCCFNFRPKNRAKCFAGDVGSVAMAFVVLFLLGSVIIEAQDLTYLVFLVVYGVDACLTIGHRILLRERLGKAHRKHAYQLMSNELGMSHILVSGIYMGLQLVISLVYLWLVPIGLRWWYLGAVVLVLSVGYVVFMKRYYHLHEEYLESVRTKIATAEASQ